MINNIQKLNDWKDYFSENFVSKLYKTKVDIKKQYIKRLFILFIIISVLWLVFVLPFLQTGKNLVGEIIEISSLMVAGWIYVPCVLLIAFALMFLIFNPKNDFREISVEILCKDMTLRKIDNETQLQVLDDFFRKENLTFEYLGKLFSRIVFGYIGFLLVSVFILIFIFY